MSETNPTDPSATPKKIDRRPAPKQRPKSGLSKPPEKQPAMYRVELHVTRDFCAGMDLVFLHVYAQDHQDAAEKAVNRWAAANPPGPGNISVSRKPRRTRGGDVELIPEGYIDPRNISDAAIAEYTPPSHLEKAWKADRMSSRRGRSTPPGTS